MTDKKLPQIASNTSIAKVLERSRTQLSVTQSLLEKATAARELSPQKDDSWIDRLYAWADENDISEFNLPRDRENLTNLTTLKLICNGLTSLPVEIGKLTNLTTLELGGNKLTSLPAEIGKLTNLTTLGLHNNDLTSLPAEIGKLTNLTTLYLSCNKPTSLPAEIGKLTNLTTLVLSGNELTSLPQEIFDLPNLNSTSREGLKKISVNITKVAKDSTQPHPELTKKTNAIKILVNAVNGEGKSKPFTIYQTIEGELPKQFVLRLDSDINRNGEKAIKLSNGNIGLVVTHKPEYIKGILAGYKSDVGDVECITCELVNDVSSTRNTKEIQNIISKKTKTEVEKLIEQNDIERASEHFAEVMNDKYSPSNDLAKMFILDKLDAASKGNGKSVIFAKKSGFLENEYEGSLKKSKLGAEHDLGEMKKFFQELTYVVADDVDTMEELSIGIVDKFMKIHSLGKYHDKKKLNKKQSSELIALYNEIVTIRSEFQKDKDFQSATALAQAGMPLGIGQMGYIDKLNKIDENILSISRITGKAPEEIAKSIQE